MVLYHTHTILSKTKIPSNFKVPLLKESLLPAQPEICASETREQRTIQKTKTYQTHQTPGPHQKDIHHEALHRSSLRLRLHHLWSQSHCQARGSKGIEGYIRFRLVGRGGGLQGNMCQVSWDLRED